MGIGGFECLRKEEDRILDSNATWTAPILGEIQGPLLQPRNCLGIQHQTLPESHGILAAPKLPLHVQVWEFLSQCAAARRLSCSICLHLWPPTDVSQVSKPEITYKGCEARPGATNVNNGTPTIRFHFPICSSNCSLVPMLRNQTQPWFPLILPSQIPGDSGQWFELVGQQKAL